MLIAVDITKALQTKCSKFLGPKNDSIFIFFKKKKTLCGKGLVFLVLVDPSIIIPWYCCFCHKISCKQLLRQNSDAGQISGQPYNYNCCRADETLHFFEWMFSYCDEKLLCSFSTIKKQIEWKVGERIHAFSDFNFRIHQTEDWFLDAVPLSVSRSVSQSATLSDYLKSTDVKWDLIDCHQEVGVLFIQTIGVIRPRPGGIMIWSQHMYVTKKGWSELTFNMLPR